MLVYNVHNVVHLVDDAKAYGSLDNVSAFCFENYLGKLFKMIRKPEKPLEQLIRRVLEKKQVTKLLKISDSHARPHDEHQSDQVPHFVGFCKQYKTVTVNGVHISIFSGNNCIALGPDIVLVRNILVKGSTILLVYQKFCEVSDFFSYPLQSSQVKIFRVSCLSSDLSVGLLSDLRYKYVLLPHQDSFVVFPFHKL
jgi:hypothetical protein